MKRNDESVSDTNNNNNSDREVGKRDKRKEGNSKLKEQVKKKKKMSKSSTETNCSSSSSSPITNNKTLPSLTREKALKSNKMRDLLNLKSTLSTKYIGSNSSPTNNAFIENDDTGRTTRHRSNMLNISSSYEQITIDNIEGEKILPATASVAATSVTTAAAASVDTKNEASSLSIGETDSFVEDSFNKSNLLTSKINGNEFDADAEDAEIQPVQKQTKRVKKRKRQRKKKSQTKNLLSTSKVEESIQNVIVHSDADNVATNKKIRPSWQLASLNSEMKADNSTDLTNSSILLDKSSLSVITHQLDSEISEDNNKISSNNNSAVVDKKMQVKKNSKKATKKLQSSQVNNKTIEKVQNTNESITIVEQKKKEKSFDLSNTNPPVDSSSSVVNNLGDSADLGSLNINLDGENNYKEQHVRTEAQQQHEQQINDDIKNAEDNVAVASTPSITPPIKSDPEMLLISPSVSLDSAKGSSIATTEINWPTYQTGYLFWGKLYSYCYWPCIVCPDPANQIVGNAPSLLRKVPPLHQLPPIQVHVRFFADNGRRNWIRQEHLIPYLGLDAFESLRLDIQAKFGIKSSKFRDMVPKKTRVEVWHQAIKEADIVAELSFTDRLEKFFQIYENSVSFQKRQRRTSMLALTAGESTSDIGSSIYGSTDKLNSKNNNNQLRATKRERSESPFSPAFSPVKGATFKSKRRKISNSVTVANTTTLVDDEVHPSNIKNEEINLSEVSPYITQQESSLHSNKEFLELFSSIKEFVIRGDETNEQMDRCLLSVANNIWSLLILNMRQKKAQVTKLKANPRKGEDAERGSTENIAGDASLKRLSSRLRNINIRRSQTPLTIPNSMLIKTLPERQVTQQNASKAKSTKNRPIDEVVDDILSLEQKYLFRGLIREAVCKYCYRPGDNLKRCSNGCNTWLHVNCKNNPPPGTVSTSARGKMLKNTGVIKKEEPRTEETINIKSNDIDIKVEHPSASSSPPPQLMTVKKEKSKPSIVTNIHITAEGESLVDVEHIVCNECETKAPGTCCICHQANVKQSTPPNSPRKTSPTKQPNDTKLLNCLMPMCSNKIHPICCQYWPQVNLSKSQVRCPAHVCHTCVSDDPKKFQQLGNAKLIKCVKCPATYHMDSSCIPAGSQILTASYIICPRHYNKTKTEAHINVTWCFMCVKGGELLCCETCPIAVHSHCRNIPMKPSENYICEECESGRFPLYGEIVWAKFNNYRWWPAIIMPPTEIPENLARKSHGPLDFVVRFFGTHDHAWIPRRRVYRYIEGDEQSDIPRSRSQLDQNFANGVAEASRFLRIIKARRQEQSIATAKNSKLYPPPYVKIKTNKAVPPVKLHIDLDKVNVCNCDPRTENPCGPDTECLNRVLFNECNPKLCLAGQRCLNQLFESRRSPRLDVVYMNERGFGLVCREPIKEGAFIIEYVGEIINYNEFLQRMSQKTRDRDENFYFLSVEKDYIIDAGPKGNLARFLNHSCEPNCVTQKWLVNGINRIGLFAMKDIPENTELTFNYFWDDILDKQKKVCHCGASKCSGEIGGKYKEETPKENLSETRKNNKTAGNKNNKFKNLKRLNKPKLKIELKLKKTNKVAQLLSSRPKKHINADDM